MRLDPLKKIAARKAQDLAVSLALAGAGALAAQAINRAMPEAHLEGPDMAFLLHLMAEKPGAIKGPVSLKDGRPWVFGFGTLLFQEGGHWFYAQRSRNKNGNGDAEGSRPTSGPQKIGYRARETDGALMVRALTGGETSLRALIAAARERYCPKNEVSLYVWEGHWNYIKNTPPRPLSTVVVDGNLDKALLSDIQAFQADRDWYHRHYVPYRRGYLLHGPPGSGKSTLAGAVAGEAGLNVCILSLNHEGLTDTAFAHALREMPKGSMLLLEDVDAVNAQTERRVAEQTMTHDFDVESDEVDWGATTGGVPSRISAISHRPAGKLTLAGILNALDGLGTPDGLIVMMTTNHRSALDPALIRPGRVDRQFYVGMASTSQAERMYARFFPEGVEHGWHESFANTLIGGEYSPAALQEHLVRHRGDPVGALTNKVGS